MPAIIFGIAIVVIFIGTELVIKAKEEERRDRPKMVCMEPNADMTEMLKVPCDRQQVLCFHDGVEVKCD